MKARILNTYLGKNPMSEEEITIAIENSEQEFEIVGVTQSQDKKIIVVKLLENTTIANNTPLQAPQETTETEAQEKLAEIDAILHGGKTEPATTQPGATGVSQQSYSAEGLSQAQGSTSDNASPATPSTSTNA